MRKIITYGTFDLLHNGHIELIRRAKELGDHLTVALSTDEFNQAKGKNAYHCYEERKTILEAIKYIDEVIPEVSWDQKVTDITKYGITTFVIGDDWEGEFDFLKDICNVNYLPRTPGISTSKIKKDLSLESASAR